LNVELLEDLIKDDRGNYYVAVHQEDQQLTLVNALVERSYRELLEFTGDFKKRHAEYEHQFIGKMAMDDLRHDLVFACKADGQGRLYELQAVEAQFRVTFIDMIEFYRHPRTGRGSSEA
jgi:hypothetical protein